jgi:hypothetical protein
MKLKGLSRTGGDLARAAGRVGTEYREVARWAGDRAFHVRVDMVGLTRPQYERVMGAVLAHERVEEVAETIRDPDLEAQRRGYIAVDVVKVANVAAACSMVLDTVRAALVDTGLAQNVESLQVQGGGT